MQFRALFLIPLVAAALGVSSGCVWITEDEVAAFNDRDGDGLDHNVDCDDQNKNVRNTAKFYPDVDGDGFGDANAQAKEFCPKDAPSDHVQDNTDCNDNNATARPGGTEVCDVQDLDEDCDGSADDADADAEGKVSWYVDDDGDGFGDELDAGVLACDPPTGSEVLDNTDCDDSRSDVSPDGTEVCDPDDVDEDCNGFADDEAGSGLDPASRIQYYDDADGDGYGNPAVLGALQCNPPGGQASNNGDCNDADNAINPAATEVCDPADVDENCNALADDADPGTDVGTMSLWYPDADGDGFGDMGAAASQSCDPGPTEVADGTDCDDSRDDVSPTSPEVCDLAQDDEDCDGLANDLDPDALQSDWWPDNDGDGFGAIGPPATTACIGPAAHAPQSGDCNDGNAAINPDAKEYHDGVDSDCDALATDWVCGEAYLRVGSGELFTTIQSAVDAVDQAIYCDGDTIEVLPGVYIENVTIADKSPDVIGLVPASTTIQGTGSGRVLSLDRTATRFQGFTITGGSIAGDGGGIRVFYGVGTVVDDVVVTGNSATNGGGIELRNPIDVTVSNSTVDSNSTTSGDGGGIRVSSTGGQAGGQILLSNLVLSNNTAGDEGGGLRVAMDIASGANNLSIVVENTVIDNNDAVSAGGMSAEIVPGLVLRNLDVTDNTGLANHGGIQIKDAPVQIEGLLLQGNTGVTVAGMQIQDYNQGPVVLTDVVALDNVLTQADGNGSAILLKGDAINGSVIRRVEVARTLRTPGPFFSWGGGLYVEGKVDAENLLIYDEAAPAGLYLLEAASGTATTHTVRNATIVGCDNAGVGVGMAIATSVTLTNLISAHNGDVGVDQVLINATVSNSDTFGNAGGDYTGTNPIGTNGNIDVDPLLLNYSAFNPSTGWDLHLGPGSPCVDTGSAAILDPDGSVSDMGYYGGPGAP